MACLDTAGAALFRCTRGRAQSQPLAPGCLDALTALLRAVLCRYAGRKVMLGVDRLDMIKGIPQVGVASFSFFFLTSSLAGAHACSWFCAPLLWTGWEWARACRRWDSATHLGWAAAGFTLPSTVPASTCHHATGARPAPKLAQ